jgi:hypothetical protein
MRRRCSISTWLLAVILRKITMLDTPGRRAGQFLTRRPYCPWRQAREQWAGMAFPETGQYAVPEALDLVSVDRDRDRGT